MPARSASLIDYNSNLSDNDVLEEPGVNFKFVGEEEDIMMDYDSQDGEDQDAQSEAQGMAWLQKFEIQLESAMLTGESISATIRIQSILQTRHLSHQHRFDESFLEEAHHTAYAPRCVIEVSKSKSAFCEKSCK